MCFCTKFLEALDVFIIYLLVLGRSKVDVHMDSGSPLVDTAFNLRGVVVLESGV